MELNEVIKALSRLTTGPDAMVNSLYTVQAVKVAISHLETLQRVKEMGGVKRRENVDHSCEFDCRGCGNSGFNRALDLKDAELAGKLEGLGEVLNKFSHRLYEADPFNHTHTINLVGATQAIQELILGKKEE